MSLCKTFGLAIFAALYLLGECTGSAQAQCNSFVTTFAVEWSDGRAINLGGLPGSTSSEAISINDAAQIVGSSLVRGVSRAAEWSGSSVVDLGGLSGSSGSSAEDINGTGQAVGYSIVGGAARATEWSGGLGGSIIDLGGLPGSVRSAAYGINDAAEAQAVGYSVVTGVTYATEWSGGGSVINLGGLGGSTIPSLGVSFANGINDSGQAVGVSGAIQAIPESLTWAMILFGFAGLAFTRYRQSRKRARDARAPSRLRIAAPLGRASLID